MKKEWRIIGIDDVSFNKFQNKYTLLVGVVCRLNGRVDGVLSTKIRVDGLDATNKIIKMIKNSKFAPQLKAVFLNGICFGGLNIVDIHKLNEELELPVIVIMRKKPHFERFYKALEHGSQAEKRKAIAARAGEVLRVGKLYVQLAGIDYGKAKKLLEASKLYSDVPEAVRLAHMIASGLGMGESRGRA